MLEAKTKTEDLKNVIANQLQITDGFHLSHDLIDLLSAAITSPTWKQWDVMKQENIVFQIQQLTGFLLKLDDHRDTIQA